jgi:hypothetical protein
MTRKTAGGETPKLDEGDDTNDSAADFESATPTPVPNAADDQPGPSVKQHARTITLDLSGDIDARGRATAKDGFERCRARAPVSVQRKRGGRWTTVETTRTNRKGRYDVHLPNAPGSYRAKATPFMATDSDECSAATSSTERA